MWIRMDDADTDAKPIHYDPTDLESHSKVLAFMQGKIKAVKDIFDRVIDLLSILRVEQRILNGLSFQLDYTNCHLLSRPRISIKQDTAIETFLTDLFEGINVAVHQKAYACYEDYFAPYGSKRLLVVEAGKKSLRSERCYNVKERRKPWEMNKVKTKKKFCKKTSKDNGEKKGRGSKRSKKQKNNGIEKMEETESMEIEYSGYAEVTEDELVAHSGISENQKLGIKGCPAGGNQVKKRSIQKEPFTGVHHRVDKSLNKKLNILSNDGINQEVTSLQENRKDSAIAESKESAATESKKAIVPESLKFSETVPSKDPDATL